MEEHRKVKHAIKRKFPILDINDSLEETLKLMAQANVSVIAVKMNEEFIGMVSVWDVMHALANQKDAKQTKISTFMTKCEFSTKNSSKNSCHQLDEDEDVLSAIKVLYEAGVNHLLITGEKHEPLGIVSSLDLIKLVASL
jgi:predicted transcriptional regulator